MPLLELQVEQKKLSPKILGRFKVGKMVGFIISRLKGNTKGKGDAFTRINKEISFFFVCVYLECKLQQPSHGLCIFI